MLASVLASRNRRRIGAVGGVSDDTVTLVSSNNTMHTVSGERYNDMRSLPPRASLGETASGSALVPVPVQIDEESMRLLAGDLAETASARLGDQVEALRIADFVEDGPRVAAVAKILIDELMANQITRGALIQTLLPSSPPVPHDVMLAMRVFCASRLDLQTYRWVQTQLRTRCRTGSGLGSSLGLGSSSGADDTHHRIAHRVTRGTHISNCDRETVLYATQLLDSQFTHAVDLWASPPRGQEDGELGGTPAFHHNDITSFPLTYDAQRADAAYKWLDRQTLLIDSATIAHLPHPPFIVDLTLLASILALEVAAPATNDLLSLMTLVPPPHLRSLKMGMFGSTENSDGPYSTQGDYLTRYLPIRSTLQMLSVHSHVDVPDLSRARRYEDSRIPRFIVTIRQFGELTHLAIQIGLGDGSGTRNRMSVLDGGEVANLVEFLPKLILVKLPFFDTGGVGGVGGAPGADALEPVVADMATKCPNLAQVFLGLVGGAEVTRACASLFARFPRLTRINDRIK
jgi:hypothetical protein